MPAAKSPEAIDIVCYNVGFGDCLLLTFRYPAPAVAKHVLLDFGTISKPEHLRTGNLMQWIANDIKKRCTPPVSGAQPHLDVLVVSHRHKDHLGSFGTKPGATIAALNPDVVIQPWTENPETPRDPLALRSLRLKRSEPDTVMRATIHGLPEVAQGIRKEALRLRREADRRKLAPPAHIMTATEWVGLEYVDNQDAVENLGAMGNGQYVSVGTDLGHVLKQVLPGVKVTVLGPPTAQDTADAIKEHSEKYEDDLWLALDYWSLQARAAGSAGTGRRLFPKAKSCGGGAAPAQARWFIRQAESVRAEQLLSIVTELDDYLNNTSVILLFEVGKRGLLFPGDAEVPPWLHALQDAQVKKRLRQVRVYKVGHHGSRNATPKSLWKEISTDTTGSGKGLLLSILSTRTPNKFGSKEDGTEIPREDLVEELKDASEELFTTDRLEASDPDKGRYREFKFVIDHSGELKPG